MKTRCWIRVSLVLITCLLLAGSTDAKRRRGRPQPDSGETQRPQRQRAENDAQKDEKQQTTAIVGADIHTVSQGIIRKGTILVRGTKITEVGQGIDVPEGAEVIDATGKIVTPGFIAMNMSPIGIRTSRSRTAAAADSLDPFDRNIKYALGVGITSGCVQLTGGTRSFRIRAPDDRLLGLEPEPQNTSSDEEAFNPDFGALDESVCACCGLRILPTEPITPTRPSTPTAQKHVVVKMNYGDLDSMLVSEQPIYGVSSRSLAGQLNRHNWRQTVQKAKDYLKEQAEHEAATKAGRRSSPPRRPVSEEIVKLVKKEIAMRVQADSVDDIRDMIALAKELDYRLVLDGATEGWLTTDELSEAAVPVVITPRRRRSPIRGREDSSGSYIGASGLYQQSGVPFAVAALSSSVSQVGIAGRDLTSLPLEAAFAVRGGCSEQTALAALTTVPAQMLGLESRLGSIEKGKDADLLILDGPPLDYRTYVETALVNGKVRYQRAVDRVYPVFER